jgi:hypothetical protein
VNKCVKKHKNKIKNHNVKERNEERLKLGVALSCVACKIALLFTLIQDRTNGILHAPSVQSRFLAGWENALSLTDWPSDQSP